MSVGFSRIVCMFDWDGDALTLLSASDLTGLVEANHRALVEHENQVLVLAAAWADLHDRDLEHWSPLVERARAVGGEGTPAVSEFAAAEFGALQGVGMVSAWNLIAAALDLRHRLPKLWGQVKAGQVRAWQARKVAEATRHLPWDACADVDDRLAGYLNTVPWPRFQKILAAAIAEADPPSPPNANSKPGPNSTSTPRSPRTG